MKIVPQSAALVWITPDAARMIERIARVCYKSEDQIGPGTAARMIGMLMERGHMAMLEHASASIHFVTDRGVSHEIVRHRIASYAQESTRYCNYGKEKFGAEITVIEPPDLTDVETHCWRDMVKHSEDAYKEMIESGVKPQIARSVLPTCLKTEIVMTANFREWLHFFTLRCAPAAHPQMRELAAMAHEIMCAECPEIYA
jgi:thymidylate synthase (FAD)